MISRVQHKDCSALCSRNSPSESRRSSGCLRARESCSRYNALQISQSSLSVGDNGIVYDLQRGDYQIHTCGRGRCQTSTSLLNRRENSSRRRVDDTQQGRACGEDNCSGQLGVRDEVLCLQVGHADCKR